MKPTTSILFALTTALFMLSPVHASDMKSEMKTVGTSMQKKMEMKSDEMKKDGMHDDMKKDSMHDQMKEDDMQDEMKKDDMQDGMKKKK